MTLDQPDGGPHYYERFSHGLPTRASYFPIGVWFESVVSQADVDKDKDAGLNLYVVLTGNSNLNLVRDNGMNAILQHGEWAGNSAARANPAVAAWELDDEIDMTQGPGAGYDTLNSILAGLPADRRLRYNNFGKGVIFWETDSEAEQFVNDFQQIVSADTYWFTDPHISSQGEGGSLFGINRDLTYAETRRASNYGATIDRMRFLDSLDGKRKPIWAFVEVGWPFTESATQGARAILPAEIKAAVWHSIIAGARGIIYFNHSFGGPDQTQHVLRDGAEGFGYAAVRSVVEATNRRVKELAPVLNSPTVRSGWSQGAGTTAMVKWVAKTKKKCRKGRKLKKGKCVKTKTAGHFYVFAGSAGSSVNGRFSLPCVGDASAVPVGENRTIPVRDGSFTDHFADGNAIHIYRINGGSTCKCKKKRSASSAKKKKCKKKK